MDLLVRTTTWTLAREASLGFQFAGINFYDGQAFMVKRSLGVTSAKQLDGATVCVQPGTTTELNLADYFRTNRMSFRAVVIENVEEIRNAFISGRSTSTPATAPRSPRSAPPRGRTRSST